MKYLLYFSLLFFFSIINSQAKGEDYYITAVDECGNPVEGAEFLVGLQSTRYFYTDITDNDGKVANSFHFDRRPNAGDVLIVTYSPNGAGTGATPSRQTFPIPNSDNWTAYFRFTIEGANSPDGFRMAYTCDNLFRGVNGRFDLSKYDGNNRRIERIKLCNGESLAACGDDLARRCDPDLNSICNEVSYSATLYTGNASWSPFPVLLRTINSDPCSTPTFSGNSNCSYCRVHGTNQGGFMPEEVAPTVPTQPGLYWWVVQAYCCSSGGTPIGDPEVYPYIIEDNSTSPGDFDFNVSFSLETRFPDGNASDGQRDRSTDLSNPAIIGAAQSGLDLSSMNGKGVRGYHIKVEEFQCNDPNGAELIATLGSGGWQLPPLDPNNLPTDIKFSDFVWEPGTRDPYFVINYSGSSELFFLKNCIKPLQGGC